MKKVNILKWSMALLLIFGGLYLGGLYLSSCNNEDKMDTAALPEQTLLGQKISTELFATGLLRSASPSHSVCGEVKEVILYAGQNIEIGTITISNDGENLYVKYQTSGGWVLHNTKLYVGPLENAPVTKSGNPKVGKFPYNTTHNPAVTTYEYVIPLSGLGDNFIVAAHADVLLINDNNIVIQQETAWGDGKRFVEQGNWAMYIEYTKQTCDECDYVPVVFPMTAPLGATVGNITVTNDGTNLYVTFNATRIFSLNATYLYVGPLAGIPMGSNGAPDPLIFPLTSTHSTPVLTYTYTLPLSNLPACYVICGYASVCETSAWGNGGVENSFLNLFGVNVRGWVMQYCTQICE